MNICMIGDSHLAMMLEANKEFFPPSVEITAITWPRQFENQFAFKGTEVSANGDGLVDFWKSCGLTQTVDLADFDKVVFISYTATMFNIFAMLRDHVVSNWNAARPVIESLNAHQASPGARRLLTPAAFQACIVGIIQSNHAYRIASNLREHCQVPMAVVPPPFLAETTLKHRPKLTGLKRVLNHKDGANLAAGYNDAHRVAFAHIPDVSVVAQPAQTVVRGCLTKDDYRAGAKRFGMEVAHSNDDVMHAGPLMGQLLLNTILDPQSHA